MALKIKVRADQVVERSDGNVKWISDEGDLNTHTEAEVSVEATEIPAVALASTASAVVQAAQDKPASKPAKAKPTAKASKAPAPVQKETAKPTAAPAPPVSDKPTAKAVKPPSKPQEKIVAKAKKKSTAKGTRTIGGKEVDLSKYVKAKSAAGGVTLHNGDATANKLAGKTLDDVYKIVARDTKQDEKELRKRYAKLNPGMQRMALGNMHRKGPREAKAVKKAA